MSRTYRRKSGTSNKYTYGKYFIDYERSVFACDRYSYGVWVPRDKNTAEYKKDLAKYHSDAGTWSHKEPGPGWFRNLYTERPQRREAKRQLKLYLLDQEFEVILNAKDKLEYWT